MTTLTSNDVANQAVQLMGGNQPLVTGQAPNFDSSTNGVALQKLYYPCVRTVAKQFGWDFARASVALVLSGNAAPVGWACEYVYPPAAVEVWQILPPTVDDPNDPLPQNWNVGNTLVANVQTKVVWANLQNAVAICNNVPSEATWDALFQEAVVRLLASELSAATAGKPDSEQNLLQSGAAFESLGEGRGG